MDTVSITIEMVEIVAALLVLAGEVVVYFLTSAGYAMMFRKSGKKAGLAFIPIVRDYQLAIISDMEEEGRIYCILMGLSYLVQIASRLFSNDGLLTNAILIARIVIMIAALIYGIRIYLSLCRVYQAKRIWVLLWISFTWIPALVWGGSKKYQPTKRFDNKASGAAAVSGATVAMADEGLTLNLTARTATEFFKKKYLLKDLHLSIPTGHMVLLLGGSGAGKTTFLNAVTGYEKADAVVTLDGRDIYREYDSMKYDIGFVPQQDLMRGSDTVLMTLKDAAKLRLPSSIHLKERNKRIQEVLDKFGLDPVRNNLTSKLSGGQRKRLSIAMEFISDPGLFILDEPDSGLDGVVARNLFQSLREIADEGKIVIVITHTPDRVIDLFDDVIVLAKDADRTGRLAYYGSVEEAYQFFEKKSMEDILRSINQKDEGGEGRADEFVEKYGELVKQKAG